MTRDATKPSKKIAAAAQAIRKRALAFPETVEDMPWGHGDWYHDGTTVRFYNPSWPGADPAAPKPTVSGFVKFIDVCPQSNSRLSLKAGVNTAYTDAASDTTLVLYFFDSTNKLISTAANYPLRAGNQTTQGLYDAAIPNGTRRIGIVPMAYISSAEQNTVFYSHLDVQYETNGWFTSRSIVSENFSSYGNSSYGGNQPTGWSEFGGDWFAIAATKYATLWNSSWGGDKKGLPPVDTGMMKSFALGSYQAGDMLNARAFAALTFTDKTSFVRLRFVFNNGATIESDRLYGNTWNDLNVRRVAIPSGATSVNVIFNAYLGPTETSSLYVDDLSVSVVHNVNGVPTIP